MSLKPNKIWSGLKLTQQYMLASFVILVCCMIGIGWWVGRKIETGVINETSATTALYMNSFIAPLLQELADNDEISPENLKRLDSLVQDTPLGQDIVSIKVWRPDGEVVYAANPELIGQYYEMSEMAKQAWKGIVSTELSGLHDEEHGNERQFGKRLLETYSPIRKQNGDEVIAVAEFYQTAVNLEAQLAEARLYGWFILIIATAVVYLVLAGIVRRGSDTIVDQQRELSDKVRQLTGLLSENSLLSERVRRAARGTTASNENFLRRISAELHDGPAQALGLALLRLDEVLQVSQNGGGPNKDEVKAKADLAVIQRSLREALEEIRKLSAGLILPELEDLTMRETLARVVRVHEQRSQTRVGLSVEKLTDNISLPVKITIYRVVQEALNNAYRHAGGKDQHVHIGQIDERLTVEIADGGPGFEPDSRVNQNGHLGLLGMRQRVESLGGKFTVDAAPGLGTRIRAEFPEQPPEGHYVQ